MPKLTDQEIENKLSDLRADTHNPTLIKYALRVAFMTGRDHGEACVIERAAELVPAANLEAEALGRAFLTVTNWVNADDGRSFHGARQAGLNGLWNANVMRSEADRVRDKSEIWSEYTWGKTMLEAMSAMATWCTEHAAAFPPRKSAPPAKMAADGLPASLPGGECTCGGAAPQNGMHEPFCATNEDKSPDTEPNL